MSYFESIQSLIQDFSKGNPLGLKLSEVQLQQEWEHLVGSTMAKHSYPESIRFKKLHLVADNSIWLQQLLFLKPAILEAIHSMMPDLALTEVILRIGSLPQPPPQPGPIPQDPPEFVGEPSPFATGLAKRLSDPELQIVLSQIITKALAEPSPSSTMEPAKRSDPEGLPPSTSLETPNAS
ncbi:MAG: hypothetical protein CO149_05045 [Nitrospirae bacterium CG_4_9_14_3_um_filter_51_5]|nr:MAG: hypothetical protein CO149_05045 [Nitrospirae bacterium CG_4_9_14_3_um_filter_51_5]